MMEDFYSLDFKEAWASSWGVVPRVGMMDFTFEAEALWFGFRLAYEPILDFSMEVIDIFSSSSSSSTSSWD
jgi:hypothetical protein